MRFRSPLDFFFNHTATTEIYTYSHTLSLHDALPISALCFWEEERGWNGIAHEAGPWAIGEYLQSPLDSRFIQSFKSVAASPLFERAMIWGKPFRFEDMGRLFLQRLIAQDRKSVVSGKSVSVLVVIGVRRNLKK